MLTCIFPAFQTSSLSHLSIQSRVSSHFETKSIVYQTKIDHELYYSFKHSTPRLRSPQLESLMMNIPFLPIPYWLTATWSQIPRLNCMIEFFLYGLCWLRHLDGPGCHSHLRSCGESCAPKPYCILVLTGASLWMVARLRSVRRVCSNFLLYPRRAMSPYIAVW